MDFDLLLTKLNDIEKKISDGSSGGSSDGSSVTLPYLEVSGFDFVEKNGLICLNEAASAKLNEIAKSKLPIVFSANMGTGTVSTMIMGWNCDVDAGFYSYRAVEIMESMTAVITLSGPQTGLDDLWLFEAKPLA